MKRFLIYFLFVVTELLVLFAVAAQAQTLSPISAEGGHGKLSGQYTVTNNGVQPAPVTVEAYSFDVVGGKASYRPLDSTAHVQLEERSARLAPKASHIFAFHVECTVLPCNVGLLSAVTIGKASNGLQVRVILPFSVYLCDKAKACRASVLSAAK